MTIVPGGKSLSDFLDGKENGVVCSLRNMHQMRVINDEEDHVEVES